MKIFSLRSVVPLVVIGVLSINVSARDAKVAAGPVHITHPYARATVPSQPSGAAYVTLENTGKSADRLIGLSSPAAGRVEMHTMSMDGTMMKMRQVDVIEIKPASSVTMKPGDGHHLMLTGLKKPLKVGERFPITLTFEKAGKINVTFVVEPVTSSGHTH